MLHLIAFLSLLLCLATASLWTRSYWIGDQWVLLRDRRQDEGTHLTALHVLSTRGTVEIEFETGDARSGHPGVSEFHHGAGTPYPLIFQSMNRTWLERIGIRWDQQQWPFVNGIAVSRGLTTLVNFPLWLATLSFAFPPLFYAAARGRCHRKSPNICSHCGYDLRATPDRCPECGMAPITARKSPREVDDK